MYLLNYLYTVSLLTTGPAATATTAAAKTTKHIGQSSISQAIAPSALQSSYHHARGTLTAINQLLLLCILHKTIAYFQ